MKKTNNLALACALAALVGCSGGGASQQNGATTPANGETGAPVEDTTGAPAAAAEPTMPTIPSSPADAPASLFAEVSIGNPNGQLSQIGTFVDQVQPGAGAMVTPDMLSQGLAGMVGSSGLAGVDWQRPLWILMFDEGVVPSGGLLVVPVTDEEELKGSLTGAGVNVLVHEGYAAVGSMEALAAGAPYGLSNRAKSQAVPEPQIKVWMRRLMDRHGSELSAVLSGMGGMDPVASQQLLAALTEIDTLTGTLVVDQKQLGAEFSAALVDGTLAQFASGQKASDFSMAGQVGTQPASVYVAGNLDLSFFAPVVEQAIKNADPSAAPLAGLLASFKGEMAMAVSGPEPFEAATVFALPEAKSVQEAVDGFVAEMAKKGKIEQGEMVVTIKPNKLKSRGGALHEISYRPAKKLPAERKKELAKIYGRRGIQAYLGVVAGRFVAVYGKNSTRRARRLMRANAKGKAGKALRAAVDNAKAQGESLLFAFDLASLNKEEQPVDRPPMAIGISFDKRQVDLRFTMPVEQAKEMGMF